MPVGIRGRGNDRCDRWGDESVVDGREPDEAALRVAARVRSLHVAPHQFGARRLTPMVHQRVHPGNPGTSEEEEGEAEGEGTAEEAKE